ncbi:MAG TPA: type II toxin-antitoxin system VapC family toxin [Solirubrobacterales bacterium]|nr:type II toxin-antitoxin system VapC family toxin [Solirubrobacterales bacterium]
MLYLDASALIKRYLREEGTEELMQAMDEVHRWVTCRVGYVETARAVGLLGADAAVGSFKADWGTFDVVEVDTELAGEAARLAVETGLRSLDAIHLAAASSLPRHDLVFATWDARLHRAAKDQGLILLPESLPA